jgi:thioredoxin-dependent peroxiredoxin
MALLEPGAEAPAFTTTDQDGKPVSLSDFRGGKVVLYFYPKDDTPGCTVEACNFRDSLPDFSKLNATVLGVSTDSEASHRKFADKYDLPFTLLADTDKKIVEAYGSWGEKKNYGKTYMGINRITYVIDEEGKIEKVYPRVDTKKHAAQLLDYLGAPKE